jgi:hypothetical protein
MITITLGLISGLIVPKQKVALPIVNWGISEKYEASPLFCSFFSPMNPRHLTWG